MPFVLAAIFLHGCGKKTDILAVPPERGGSEFPNEGEPEALIKVASGPYLVFIRNSKLVLADVAEPGIQREIVTGIKGYISSALIVDKGHSLLVVADSRELWKITPGVAMAQKLWTGSELVHLEAASSDGRVVLAGYGKLFEIGKTQAKLVDLRPPVKNESRIGAMTIPA